MFVFVGTQVAIKICQQPCNCCDIFTLSWYINIVKLQLCTKEILLRNLMYALLRLIVRDGCLIWCKLCQDASVGNWWYHFYKIKEHQNASQTWHTHIHSHRCLLSMSYSVSVTKCMSVELYIHCVLLKCGHEICLSIWVYQDSVMELISLWSHSLVETH